MIIIHHDADRRRITHPTPTCKNVDLYCFNFSSNLYTDPLDIYVFICLIKVDRLTIINLIICHIYIYLIVPNRINYKFNLYPVIHVLHFKFFK